jgi:hypothetical protein
MWTPLKLSDGSKDQYGLGWGTWDENGIPVVGHILQILLGTHEAERK